MKHRYFPALVVLGIIVILSCRTADVLSPQPTPESPVSLPTTGSAHAAPTSSRVLVPTVAPSPPLVIAAPTLQTGAPTQSPPAQSSTCSDPNASITAPTMDRAVSGLIEIRGTATRSNMQYWKVEYRPETSTNYIALNNSEQAVTDGVLARWSTKTVPNGVYFVRLVLVQKDGNFGTPCEIKITISN